MRLARVSSLAEKFKVPLLGEIPLIPDVVSSGDSGMPITLSQPDSPASQAYRHLAGQVGGADQHQSVTGSQKSGRRIRTGLEGLRRISNI